MPQDLTAIYYRAAHRRLPGMSLVIALSPTVMARARSGDKSAQNNICIAYRKKLREETSEYLDRVEWNELTFEPLLT